MQDNDLSISEDCVHAIEEYTIVQVRPTPQGRAKRGLKCAVVQHSIEHYCEENEASAEFDVQLYAVHSTTQVLILLAVMLMLIARCHIKCSSVPVI